MPFVCHLYVIVCKSYVMICHLYVLFCHPYITHMYSYVICMSLVCIRMSSIRHSYVLDVICMSLICGFTINQFNLVKYNKNAIIVVTTFPCSMLIQTQVIQELPAILTQGERKMFVTEILLISKKHSVPLGAN